MKVLKKYGLIEDFNTNKIKNACNLAAERALIKLQDEDFKNICDVVLELINNNNNYFDDVIEDVVIPVSEMHSIVENALSKDYPEVAERYIQYRNYKQDFVKMLNEVYIKEQEQRYIGDVSNANTDSTMISTQRSLSYGTLSKELYKKFFLTKDELQATNDGYIYIHDMKDRRDGINCCLFNIKDVLKDGFEFGNIYYSEPKTLDTAFDVIGDIVFGASANQYGGFTLPEIDKILAFYAKKSYQKYKKEYLENTQKITNYICTYDDIPDWEYISDDLAEEYAIEKVCRDFEQGFQGWEYKFNTVASSRGDYPFIAMSFGIGTGRFETMASEMALKVRMGGQGKEGFKKPVLFPKLTFLYDDNLHGEGKELEWLFDIAIECSKKCMYPDFLSLSGEGYIPSMYKKYGKVVSLMGCRASLSPWYERGGMHPLDEKDTPVFEGRFNLGAITLHLPMILAESRRKSTDFYKLLDYYLEMIRNLHKRTYAFLGEKKASTNPLGFMQGGFLGGTLNANDKIKSILPPMTMSFGITALNELQYLYNGKSIVEDGEFALEVMKYINDYIDRIKEEDNILYAVYGTPAESLCGTQVQQFRKRFGIIAGVSDRLYTSNSFHCGVWEDITPIEKQDLENRFWDYFNGGKIQYCKYPVNYNTTAIKTIIRRAMEMGFYEGVNLSLAYCEKCGHEELNMEVCPKCGSDEITQIERMNGYLGFNKIKGHSRYNDAKRAEIAERKSM